MKVTALLLLLLKFSPHAVLTDVKVWRLTGLLPVQEGSVNRLSCLKFIAVFLGP
jgi:hypothetical protein